MTGKQRLFALVLLFALVTRTWMLDDPSFLRLDESLHVPTSQIYRESGHVLPDNWHHPPLKHILLAGSIALLGNDPIGWRARNALFGFCSIILLYLLGRRLFPDERIGVLAAAFLAADPVHLLASRSTTEEVVAVFFMLVFLYAFARYLEEGSGHLLVGAGIGLGLSLSVKWYFLLLMPLAVALALRQTDTAGRRSPASVAAILLTFTCVPLSIYLLSYYPWFGRGYSLLEFLDFQVDAFQELQDMKLGYFYNLAGVDSGAAGRWFLKPVMVLFGFLPGDAFHGRYQVFLSNFPVLLFTIPSAAFAAWQLRPARPRSGTFTPGAPAAGPLRLLLLTFGAIYLPMLLVKRPFFLYSIITVLPSVYLLIAFFLVSLFGKERDHAHSPGFLVVLVILILLWGAYAFPFVSGFDVPTDVYAPLLRLLTT